MIAILVAAGMFAASPPAVPSEPGATPPERVITVRRNSTGGGGTLDIPSDAAMALASMDPSDTLDFLVKLGDLLDEGETFTDIAFAVVASSVIKGFTILSTPTHASRIVDDTDVLLWVTVSTAKRDDTAWRGGQTCGAVLTTQTSFAREYQRTIAVRIVEK